VHVRVCAQNADGWSGASNVAVATAAPDVPGSVDGLDNESRTRSSCTVSWTGAADNGSAVTGWMVMNCVEGGSWSAAMPVEATERDFTIKNMKPATAVSFRVAAVNQVGIGVYSEDISCTSGATVPCAPPAVSLEDVTDSSFEVSWEEPADNGQPVQFYRLQLVEADETWSGIEYEGQERSYQAVGMETGVSYRVRVQAVNCEGASPYSSIHAVSTLPGKPDPPVGLAAVSVTASTIKLKWRRAHSRGSAVCQYRVRLTCAGTNGAPENIITTQGNILTCKFSKLNQLTEYQAAVSALSIEGEGEVSAPITVSTTKEVVVVKRPDPEPKLRTSAEAEDTMDESYSTDRSKPQKSSPRNKAKPDRQRNFAHLKQIEEREQDERRKRERLEASWRYKIRQFFNKLDSMYLAGGFVFILVIVMVSNSGGEKETRFHTQPI